MNLFAFASTGFVLGILASRAGYSWPKMLGWALLAIGPPLMFSAPGLLRPKPNTYQAVYEKLRAPGIHTIIEGENRYTAFVWQGLVNDSLYIVGMRPVRAVIFVDHGSVTDTLRWGT